MVTAVILGTVANVAILLPRDDDATNQEITFPTEDEPFEELSWRAVGDVGADLCTETRLTLWSCELLETGFIFIFVNFTSLLFCCWC